MIRIAVIGDIGSGKSYVAKKFGYPVFNADFEVDKIYKKNRSCFKKLKKTLPDFIYSFPINKYEISKAIIENNLNLKKIIKIIHPMIKKKMNFFLKENKSKKIVLLDIPLFLENKINKKNDVLVFVQSKKKEINKRLKRRKNFNHKLIEKFRKIQLPLENKKKKCRFVIKNNFTNSSVEKSVKYILSKII